MPRGLLAFAEMTDRVEVSLTSKPGELDTAETWRTATTFLRRSVQSWPAQMPSGFSFLGSVATRAWAGAPHL